MNFSDEQKAILELKDRLGVVRACPGSGKTSVFVEAMRRFLDEGLPARKGIAALSFTNSAKEEVESRLGGPLPAPHFIGTLDAFMYRFIVKPFGTLVGVSADGAQLIPAALAHHYDHPEVWFGGRPEEKVCALEVHATGGEVDAPTFVLRHPVKQKMVVLSDALGARALQVKRGMWRNSGRLSHSDCHLIAAQILRHPEHGQRVAELVAERFPIILVDEFQDTGHFLGKALLSLLACERVRGLVVGDPDQTIYEFGGASPGLFSEAEALPGAVPLTLSTTRRCPLRVAAVATALSSIGASVSALQEADDGSAILLVHRFDTPSAHEALVKRLQEHHGANKDLVVLARRGKVVRQLVGRPVSELVDGSAFARKIERGTQLLKAGDASGAARQVAAVLSRLAFGMPSLTLDQLRQFDIEPSQWRKAQFEVLRAASRAEPGETWNDWLARVKEAVGSVLHTVGHPIERATLSSKFRRHRNWDGPRPVAGELPHGGQSAEWPLGAKVATVHQVKGAEFDTVALFVPKPHASHAPCPSREWWGQGEEQRIAFVAASRAKKTFILCVHEDTFARLRDTRAEFAALFTHEHL